MADSDVRRAVRLVIASGGQTELIVDLLTHGCFTIEELSRIRASLAGSSAKLSDDHEPAWIKCPGGDSHLLHLWSPRSNELDWPNSELLSPGCSVGSRYPIDLVSTHRHRLRFELRFGPSADTTRCPGCSRRKFWRGGDGRRIEFRPLTAHEMCIRAGSFLRAEDV